MAKIKHTKNELKAQRDALKRFQRYLPTLLLKKQQLQLEVRGLEAKVEAKRGEEKAAREQLAAWVKLFAEPLPLDTMLKIGAVKRSTGNIAASASERRTAAVSASSSICVVVTAPMRPPIWAET